VSSLELNEALTNGKYAVTEGRFFYLREEEEEDAW
jgi:hypothetical protein